MRRIFNVGGGTGYKRFDYVIKKGGNVFHRTEHPLTIGLIPGGFLCNFVKKYMCWVLTLLPGLRYAYVCASM